MNKKWIGILLTSFACATTMQAGIWETLTAIIPKHVHAKPMGVRVLLAHDVPGVTLGITGKYKIFDPNTKELISTRFIGKRKYIEAIEDGIKWQEEFPGIYQLLIVTDDPKGSLTLDGVEYRGAIYVYNVGGTISVVNELTVEEYLNAILARLCHENVTTETLAALAITTRTDVMHQLLNPRNPYWVIDARSVGFKGYEAVNPSSPVSSAIAETHGMVLVDQAANYFPAKWNIDPNAAKESGVFSNLTLEEADKLAKEGLNAVEILFKAFPGSKLNVIQQ